jgi:large subunit ribosomal protein L9
VTSADVAELLAARSITVDRRKIQLPDPLKSVGDHKVPVRLHRDVVAELTVKVVAAG